MQLQCRGGRQRLGPGAAACPIRAALSGVASRRPLPLSDGRHASALVIELTRLD